MAEFRAWNTVDLRGVNFHESFEAASSALFYDNTYLTVHGRTYEDLLALDYSTPDLPQVELWLGSGIRLSGGAITAGTLTAVYDTFYNYADGLWYYNLEFRGFSIPAVDLYRAQLTESRVDDETLLSKMLAGNDLIELHSTSADNMEGRSGNDQMSGGGGRDTLVGGFGNDTIAGEQGFDLLQGNYGSDKLTGGYGNDTLQGGHGADRLGGGPGNDVLTGGSSDLKRDVFVFQTGSGDDRITDFQDGVDRIEYTSGPTSFAQLALTQSGTGVLVEYGSLSVLVEHTRVSALTAADFLFT